jgi:hypothetical protein
MLGTRAIVAHNQLHRRTKQVAINQRRILGPANPYDDGQKTNYVPGQEPSSGRSGTTGVIDYDTSAVSDQGGVGTAAARAAEQDAFRAAQRSAGLISGAGAAGTVVAPAGDVQTEGNVQPGGPGAVVAASGGVTVRADGGDDPAGSAYGKAIS